MANKKGFTLVELLVVTAIFGLLIAVVLTNVTPARTRARDSRRERDIKSLQTALANYASSARNFPLWQEDQTTFQHLTCVSENQIFSQLLSTGSLSAPICDPVNSTAHRYEYRTTNFAGSSYEIRYTLETDSISGKSAGPQTVGP